MYSRSGKDPNAPGHVWQSDGSGEYEVAEAANVQRGTKIVIELKKEEKEFSRKEAIEDMIHRYSSFVGYPIHVNGDNINTIKALWLEPADRISEEEHTEFYRFVSSAFDAPRYTLHYSVDAPLQMRSLLYIPSFHTENLTGSRMEPGVHLYCRKVLIKSKVGVRVGVGVGVGGCLAEWVGARVEKFGGLPLMKCPPPPYPDEEPAAGVDAIRPRCD